MNRYAEELVATAVAATIADAVASPAAAAIGAAGVATLLLFPLPRFAFLPTLLVLRIELHDLFRRELQMRRKLRLAGLAFGETPIENMKAAGWTAILHLGPYSIRRSIAPRLGSHMRHFIAALALAIPLSALAAEPDAVAKKEIERLIAHLASSGCEFGRNGSWYSAAKAVSHLQRKYEYLLERDLVPNAEAFIERAASESSSSGKPYIVKCPGQPEIQSGDWFRSALATFRTTGAE